MKNRSPLHTKSCETVIFSPPESRTGTVSKGEVFHTFDRHFRLLRILLGKCMEGIFIGLVLSGLSLHQHRVPRFRKSG